MNCTLTQHLHGDLCSKTSCHPTSVHHSVCQAAPHGLIRAHQPAAACRQHLCSEASRSWPSRQQALTAHCSSPGDTCCSSGVQLGWNIGFGQKFAVGQVLGRGSYGTVHEAVHKLTGNSYAVKVLKKPSKLGGVQLESICREVDTWRQAQGSSFVARLEGLYEDEEHAYIVQELCAGGDLKCLLDANGCVSEVEAATIMRGVLDMLVELHSKSICYGDLKPANIMFSHGSNAAPASSDNSQRQLHVRAVDFGCSRVSAKGRPLTQLCGSPLYMAPEMALQRFGVGVDVWAAGVVMYQILVGRLPFWKGKSVDDVAKLPPYEIVAGVRCNEVHLPREGLSHEARQLLQGMLDRNPATRLTAEQCLLHPWFAATLGYTPTPSGRTANNVVEFPHHHSGSPVPAQPHQRASPIQVPLSPSRGSNNSAGLLSPSRSSTALPRRTLSGELPSCNIVPELFRAQVPVMVPAAE